MFELRAHRIFSRGLILVLFVGGLTACGFRLAGSADLPPQLAQIHLVTRDMSDSLQDRLRQRLRRAGASLVAADAAQAVRLTVKYLVLPRRVLASSGGKTVERIARGLDFSLSDAGGKQLANRSLRQQREFTLDEDNLLASTREREDVVRDLERALFNQLILQLQRI